MKRTQIFTLLLEFVVVAPICAVFSKAIYMITSFSHDDYFSGWIIHLLSTWSDYFCETFHKLQLIASAKGLNKLCKAKKITLSICTYVTFLRDCLLWALIMFLVTCKAISWPISRYNGLIVYNYWYFLVDRIVIRVNLVDLSPTYLC